MSLYVIADLHLSFNKPKPMDIFGFNWENHTEKIKNNWKIKDEDTVLLLGDFSWAMKLQDTIKDFEYLNSMPGKKIMLKGNHDYWWTTITNMKNFLKDNNIENIDFLHNNSFLIEDKIIIGTRGWTLVGEETLNSKKIIKRECERLRLSIEDGIKKYGDNKEIICCMHYPPIVKKDEMTDFIKIMKDYNIKKCFYGHLHGDAIKDAIEGNYFGIDFKLISSDGVDFKLTKIK